MGRCRGEKGDVGARQALIAAGAAALLGAAWALVCGKDVNWDQLHYHYYVAHALVEGRVGQDYLAASTQSYLNPLGYLPFYLMTAAGWHSVAVSALLAALHALNAALLYAIGLRVFSRRILALLGAAAGAASAVFFALLGSSFLDPLLTLPMLAAVLLFLRGGAVAPGALFGAAAALKYSNAYFALAGLWLAASTPAADLRGRLRACATYALGGIVAVAVLGGPWFALVYREFGNPLFPHLNALFRSPDFPPVNLGAERYAAQGLGDALAFPFRLASPHSMTYVEIAAPDFRLAVLALALVALAASVRVPSWRAPDGRLLGFFALAAALWIATSGNGRYGLLVLLLAGPCLAAVLARLMPLRFAALTLCVLIAAQIGACVSVSPARWFIADRWSQSWFPFVVPERARREPALYLTVETQSMAAIAPFLHRDSAFVNVRGQYSLAPGLPRLDALLERHRGRARVLGRALRAQADGRPGEEALAAYDATLERFDLRVDARDCFFIAWRPDDADRVSRWVNALAGEIAARETAFSMGSCALVAAPPRPPGEVEAEKRISAVFDRVERACPRLFRHGTAVTEKLGAEWSRIYSAPEARLQTRSGRLLYVPLPAGFRYLDLGALAEWDSGAAPTRCPAGG